MALLVVHGLLHLLGMDHEVEAEAEHDGGARARAPRPLPPPDRRSGSAAPGPAIPAVTTVGLPRPSTGSSSPSSSSCSVVSGVPGPGRDQPRPDLARSRPRRCVDEGRRGARAAGAAGRAPRAVPEPGAAARAHLPAGLGHPRRACWPTSWFGAARGARRHRLRGGGHLRPLRGGAQELGRPQPRAGGPASRAPIVSAVVRFPPVRAVSAVLIGLANLLIGRAEARAAGGPT